MSGRGIEIRLLGQGISRGIAIGQPFFFSYAELVVPNYEVPPAESDKELRRFKRAIELSRQEIGLLKEQLLVEGATEASSILEAQECFFIDPIIHEDIASTIRECGRNAEAVFHLVWQKYHMRFQGMQDRFFRDRFDDLLDLYRRVLRHLGVSSGATLTEVPSGAIVFASTISPSDTASVRGSGVGAFVTQKGGVTSHAAIVARAKGIPYVANLDISSIPTDIAGPVIVDGRTGVVILNPRKETIARYEELQHCLNDREEVFHRQAQSGAETIDGCVICLSANIEGVGELSHLHRHEVAGIGLFRSEYLFLSKNAFPSEEEQVESYRAIFDKMEGLPVVIRAFDVGGDKYAMDQSTWREVNPYLGYRAIRFLLRKPKIFRTQLRAILRASGHGDVSILFPMVTNVSELRQVKNVLDQVKQTLIAQGHKVPRNIRIGSMIEVPGAALTADLLAQECDFLSIGTNDLVQYTMAVNRGDDTVSGQNTATHPSVLRLLNWIISQAAQKGVPVSICGEMAADPRFTALLLGMGLRSLSVSIRHIPLIKNVIRNLTIVQARHLAECALRMTDAGEIFSFLSEEYRLLIPDDALYNPDLGMARTSHGKTEPVMV